MDGQLDVKTIAVTALALGALYTAYKDPHMGTAILCGVAVISLLSMLLKR